MVLDYIALGILVFVVLVIFYGVIVIHDIPYEIAKHRNHPHQDAIHVAGWVSLFTLHVLWPFLWIWATVYRPDRGWGFNQRLQNDEDEITALKKELAVLQARMNTLEQTDK
ncbi:MULTISPECIES: DUF3302 domain-containing protein [Aeromonas]|uniref:DUF3302 domain-containing protein n=1 Tax=Aeromonas taiwanensis TaxID=633417 RepID=A0A5F0K9V9_9GAMM|nr:MULTISPECIES: DUF3302 domain-containing protein [Aeromonas]MBP4040793.1 DUF3302 domain-containing protein [Aeromonas sp. SrichE-2G]MCO4202508.1 DUF3302 domain-containing protein [Aeromonas taiwanensis]TFF74845.1 DUF3302 domain-containing protein [Aeromonas taiwanensis]TFF75870.1 DUF3302 domain-containing protein [Aeromonas taiwanensis]TFF79106.1 DUF3302 domain-containing protein [Aeromonas taiwanensis]